jgi:excinuclease ABC subunit A
LAKQRTKPAAAGGVVVVEVTDVSASIPSVSQPANGALSPRPTAPVPLKDLDRSRCIRVRGAREHNLKDLDVDIPRDRLVVITGLSGSGKSSLAFDTIFAEGQRKYMESLSAYARQFLDQLKKPDVDDIEGLPPTIAIEQRSGVSNPRSTVATTTEIYDYLRLLYARCGLALCWAPTKVRKDGVVLERCGRPIQATASTQIVDAVMALTPGPGVTPGPGSPEGAAVPTGRLIILAPVVRQKKGFHKDALEELQKQGWGRVRVNGVMHEIRDVLAKGGENPLELGRYEKHDVDIVVDRVVLKPDMDPTVRQRLAESIESALRAAHGTVVISVEEATERRSDEATKGEGANWSDRIFSEKHSCAVHPEASLPEMSPRLFSFNSHMGACPECHGLGVIMEFDENLVIPDQSKTLAEGAIKPWKVPPPMGRFFRRRLKAFCELTGWSVNRPVSAMPEATRRILMSGTTPADQKKLGGKFEGVTATLRNWYERTESSFIREWLGQYMQEKPCPTCAGDRLRIEALSVFLESAHRADTAKAFSQTVVPRQRDDGRQLNIAEFSRLTITDALAFVEGLKLSQEHSIIAEPILKEVKNRLGFLASVGLEYLSLDRKTGTLSGGEAQRIRLATQVGSKLVGACYVLDEPTIGLHQRDNARLIATLRHLADIGNSVLVVEHDEDMIRHADHVLDIGPGPGVHGGRVVAQGTVDDICAVPGSITGQYLSGIRTIDPPAKRRDLSETNAVCIKGASENNLKKIDVAFPLGGLICVTGVSGSGKSTLVNDILLAGLKKQLHQSRGRVGAHARITGLSRVDRVIEVDQSPIGRTPRSNPATYTGIFDEIRKLFAATKEAKIRGYKPGRFSFNVRSANGGGRCEACEGQGLKKIEMHFLPDVFVNCEVCGGTRFNRETLEVAFRGKNIADVLKMTVEEACTFFENHPKILRFVQCLRDVGLNYVELGQPSTTLSGGEAQRIKLATELGKGSGGVLPNRGPDSDDPGSEIDETEDGADESVAPARNSPLGTRNSVTHTLYILDEPTTGLHFEDVSKLVGVLNRLADAGNTLVVIEHNLDVIKCADWIIDLGPEGGDRGGSIVAKGTPEQVAKSKTSYTGAYLSGFLR